MDANLQTGADGAARAPSPEDLFFPFTIGGMECVTLSDGFVQAPLRLLAPEIPEPELKAFMSAHGEDGDLMRVLISCLLVRMPGSSQTMLVDAGLGRSAHTGAPVETAGRLREAFAKAGIDRASVDIVLVSHIHPDHVGGLFLDDDQPTFPNARYFVSQEEVDFWGAAEPDLSGTIMPPFIRTGVIAIAQRFLALAADRLTIFKAGDDVLDNVGTILLDGHTPGQVGFMFRGEGQSLYYTADAAGHSGVSVQKPDWRFSFDTDAPLAIATRKRLLASLIEMGCYNFTPHFPWPAVGRLKMQGDRLTWKAGV
jgi:glyoxylase-like metal-dependent hydrolase (beta-lactamase superfamily II)